MFNFKKWLRGWRQFRSLTKPNDFIRIFKVRDGQVSVEMSYPQIPGDVYALIQTTVLHKTIKARITTDFETEVSMRNAYLTFTKEMAQKFHDDMHKVL